MMMIMTALLHFFLVFWTTTISSMGVQVVHGFVHNHVPSPSSTSRQFHQVATTTTTTKIPRFTALNMMDGFHHDDDNNDDEDLFDLDTLTDVIPTSSSNHHHHEPILFHRNDATTLLNNDTISAIGADAATSSGGGTATMVKPPPIAGIGGKNGYSYNVNKLKTNLVQQAVANYKKQLWDLLGNNNHDDNDNNNASAMNRDALVEEKLAALCQANPVRTTTDSNVLDGTWHQVLISKQPAAVLLDSARFEIQKHNHPSNYNNNNNGFKNQPSSTRTEQDENQQQQQQLLVMSPGVRQIQLENLDSHQDPYVVDSKPFPGGLQRVQQYRVSSLTRTTLDLTLVRTTWKLWAYPLKTKRYRIMAALPHLSPSRMTTSTARKAASAVIPPKMTIKILYIDTDLCICVNEHMHPGTDANKDDDFDDDHDDPLHSDYSQQPFYVYTKSPEWVARTQQIKRKWRTVQKSHDRIMDGLSLFPTRSNNNNSNNKKKKMKRNGTSSSSLNSKRMTMKNSMWMEYTTDDGDKLRVVRLGDYDYEEMAWEGAADPFGHLLPDERQRLLKELDIGEIEMMKTQLDIKNRNRQRQHLNLRKSGASQSLQNGAGEFVLERKREFQKPVFDKMVDTDFLQE